MKTLAGNSANTADRFEDLTWLIDQGVTLPDAARRCVWYNLQSLYRAAYHSGDQNLIRKILGIKPKTNI